MRGGSAAQDEVSLFYEDGESDSFGSERKHLRETLQSLSVSA